MGAEFRGMGFEFGVEGFECRVQFLCVLGLRLWFIGCKENLNLEALLQADSHLLHRPACR